MTTIAITGGHSGLGLICSKKLALLPKVHLLMLGRSTQKIEAVAAKLRSASCTVTVIELDLASLASVRKGADRIRTLSTSGQIPKLDALILNAGIQTLGGTSASFSIDHHEETFAVNGLGNFLLVNLLMDVIAPHGRIVFTASGTHDGESMDGRIIGKAVQPDVRQLAANKPALRGGVRYATSKLCEILYAYELHRRLRAAGKGITVIAYDPGFIPETGLADSSPKIFKVMASQPWVKSILKRIGVTIGREIFSAESLAVLATDARYKDSSNKYFQSHDGVLYERKSSKMSYDARLAGQVWEDSKKLTGIPPTEIPNWIA
jgi:NAD(P)-dependent dehydrogenase (short-subunit alcohol dehydrogenase family)